MLPLEILTNDAATPTGRAEARKGQGSAWQTIRRLDAQHTWDSPARQACLDPVEDFNDFRQRPVLLYKGDHFGFAFIDLLGAFQDFGGAG